MFRNPLEERGGVCKGGQNQSWLPNPCLLGAHKWAEMLYHPCILGDPQTKGDKIRIAYLTLAFWGAHKWAQMLCHPCILGDPQTKGEQNQNWLPNPCFLGSPQVGGNATSPLHSRGSPNKRGTKSELAA